MSIRRRIFDNGTSTISHSAATPGRRSDRLVVTFDHVLALDVDAAGFGETFLLSEGFDVLSVQKRTEGYYQDLSLEAFRDAAAGVAAGYREIVFYGSSLGAYAAHYYAAPLGGRILSLSPLCPIHPTLWRAGPGFVKNGVAWTHRRLVEVADPDADCRITYDPMDRTDRRFFTEEVRPAFPRAAVVPLPQAGHPVGITLMELKALKPHVLSFLQGAPMPALSTRGRKAESPRLLKTMAARALERGRIPLALALADRIVRLRPADPAARAFRDEIAARPSAAAAPETPHATLERGRTLLGDGRVPEAEAAFRAACACADPPPWWRYLHALALYRLDRFADAVSTLTADGAIEPLDAEALNLLALAHAALGHVEPSVSAFLAASARRPAWLFPLERLADLLDRAGRDPAAALDALARAETGGLAPADRLRLLDLRVRLHGIGAATARRARETLLTRTAA